MGGGSKGTEGGFSRHRGSAIALLIAVAAIGAAIGLLREPDRAPPDRGSADRAIPAPPVENGDAPPVEGEGDGEPEAPLPTGPLVAGAGVVIDHRTGRGVPGAWVTITAGRDARAPPLANARTDSAGAFALRCPDRDPIDIAVRADGYAPARWSLAGGLTPEGLYFDLGALALEIAPESALWIQAELPGLPAEEPVVVELQLRQSRTPAELGEPLVLRESEAIFAGGGRIGSLAMGSYLLSFRTSELRLGTREVELGMGEERTIEFSVGPPVPVRGTIRHNGRPVSGGKLVIWGRDHASHAATVVDGRGGYSASLPEAGSYSFAYTPSRRAPEDGAGGSREVEVAEPGVIDLDFRTVRLEGRVTGPDGAPVAELAGTLFGPQALSFVTDSAGEFGFESVPPGVYRWLFAAPPPGCFGPAAELAVEGDTEARYEFAAAVELEVHLVGEPTAVGEVGAPQVGLLAPGGEITPLRPTGAPERYWWPAGGGLGVVSKRGSAPWFFEVPPGERPPRQVVELRPGGELTVAIFAEDGRALGGQPFRIDAIDAPRLPAEWRERRTGPRGSAVLALPPGLYRVSADLPAGPAAREIRIVEHASTQARLP